MTNLLLAFSVILVATILIGINHESFFTENQIDYLNKMTDIGAVDTDIVKNNSSFYSTIGNLLIINDDTIQITFNNENDFGLIKNGVKVWSIPEQFEFTKTFSLHEKFITHCIENTEGGVNIDFFEISEIDTLKDQVSLIHYVGIAPGDLKCKHPDIIIDGFSNYGTD